MVSAVGQCPISTGVNAGLHTKYALSIQVHWNASKHSDLDVVSKIIWRVQHFPGSVSFVVPPPVFSSLWCLIYKMHSPNVTWCYGREQFDFGKCWSDAEMRIKLLWQTRQYTLKCCRQKLCSIVHSVWKEKKGNEMLRPHPQTEWNQSDECSSYKGWVITISKS